MTRYRILVKANLLLKMLHAPFLSDPETPTSDGAVFFQQTLATTLDRLLTRTFAETRDCRIAPVRLLLTHALIFLKSIVTRFSHRYFEELVPYVTRMYLMDTERASPDPVMPFRRSVSLSRSLQDRLIDANLLYEKYAKYSVAFDAVHVAALCCLCQDDPILVSELVLDFVGQFYSGYYDAVFEFPGLSYDPLEWKIRQLLLLNRAEPPTNRPWSRHLKLFEKGGVSLADHFSDTFFQNYGHLRVAILNQLESPDSLEWVFPRMLFMDQESYWAFIAASAHYWKTSVEGADVLAECKALYVTVYRSLSKVKSFHVCQEEQEWQRRKNQIQTKDEEEAFVWADNDDLGKVYHWSLSMVNEFLRMDGGTFVKDWVNSLKGLSQIFLNESWEKDLFTEPPETPFKKGENWEYYMQKKRTVPSAPEMERSHQEENGTNEKNNEWIVTEV